MPRVRIGLTGLACVFLLVLIAAALFGNQRVARPVVPEEPLAELGVAPGGAPPEKPATTTTTTVIANDAAARPLPREPLAELGVAPGGAEPDPAPTQPGATAAVAGTPQPDGGAAH
jgi:hypothetical protein